MYPVLLFVELFPQLIDYQMHCPPGREPGYTETKGATYVYKEAKILWELPMFYSDRSRQPMTWKTSKHHALYKSVDQTQLSPASTAALFFVGQETPNKTTRPLLQPVGNTTLSCASPTDS